MGYSGLQGVTMGYKGLEGVWGDYKGLQGVTGGYEGVTLAYKGLQKGCPLTRTSPDTFCWSIFHRNQGLTNLKV